MRLPSWSKLKPVVLPALAVVVVVTIVAAVVTTELRKGTNTADAAGLQLTDSPAVPSSLAPSPTSGRYSRTATPLLLTFYGLDMWSLVHSWGSGIQALLEAQQPPSLSLQGLSAPGMCASQLLALNTTALLNTSLTAQELMPGLGYFTADVAQLLRDFLQDSSITVQVMDFCAGNRTLVSFSQRRALRAAEVNDSVATLVVSIALQGPEPDRLASTAGPLEQLLLDCRGALMTRDSLPFFTLYAMPSQRCQAALLPSSPPSSPSPPPSSPSPSPPAPPP
ncbi:hypothetical protein QJQ45_010492 [Haematococcus lacustris]|nr:hypothetical protein QJQ45_010492 [Haematococcus lacustris]